MVAHPTFSTRFFGTARICGVSGDRLDCRPSVDCCFSFRLQRLSLDKLVVTHHSNTVIVLREPSRSNVLSSLDSTLSRRYIQNPGRLPGPAKKDNAQSWGRGFVVLELDSRYGDFLSCCNVLLGRRLSLVEFQTIK